MSALELIGKINELKELEALIKETEAEVEKLKDEIKAEMSRQNTEEIKAGRYTIKWTCISSSRFDTTAFKNVMPDMYEAFVRQTASKRFTISG